MSLPKIAVMENTFRSVGTGDEIRFRPFTVKEEKVLLVSLESGDKEQIESGMRQVMQACILNDVEVENLPFFDFEHLFLRMRSVSVSNTANLAIGHQEENPVCSATTPHEVDLNDVHLSGEPPERRVPVTDVYGVMMRYPTVVESLAFESTAEGVVELSAKCIESVYELNGDGVWEANDYEETKNWIGDLTSSQFQKLVKFFTDLPRLRYQAIVTCQDCGEEIDLDLQGMQSFFT